MSYRDDHAAAVARVDVLDRDNARLGAEVDRLQAELATAQNWLGGPRVRAFALAGACLVALGLGLGGFAIGRMTVELPAPAAIAPEQPLPFTIGTLVADGPKVGYWTLDATTCNKHGDGVELRAAGNQDRVVWVSDDLVEVEYASGSITLDAQKCHTLEKAAHRNPHAASLDGYVSLECRFGDIHSVDNADRLHGRIEFRNCR